MPSALLSVGLLGAAVLVCYTAGARWSVRLALVIALAFGGIGLALWFGLNQITGVGINDAVFYHLATGLEGSDISQYFGLMAGCAVCLIALFYGSFRLFPALPRLECPPAANWSRGPSCRRIAVARHRY